ncbi:MAG: tail fiber domain-containing protein, partial [Bacteroidetes bacterium]|nr:tail fiber domain-containing protein [Bacteroidota bacterium]
MNFTNAIKMAGGIPVVMVVLLICNTSNAQEGFIHNTSTTNQTQELGVSSGTLSIGEFQMIPGGCVFDYSTIRVGIGAQLPQNTLHVRGGVRIETLAPPPQNVNMVVVDQLGDLYQQEIPDGADDDWYEVGTTTAPDDIADNIYTNGNVGMGTIAPIHPLHLINNLTFTTGFKTLASFNRAVASPTNAGMSAGYHANGTIADYNWLYFPGEDLGTAFRLYNNTSYIAMYFDNNANPGFTGIGPFGPALLPEQQLDVMGNARIRAVPVGGAGRALCIATNGDLFQIDHVPADADWFEAGATAPNAITDNIYTYNFVGIGDPGMVEAPGSPLFVNWDFAQGGVHPNGFFNLATFNRQQPSAANAGATVGYHVTANQPDYSWIYFPGEIDAAFRLWDQDANAAYTAMYIDNDGATNAQGFVGIGRYGPGNLPPQQLSVAGNICLDGITVACSDIRYKKNIKSIESSLDKVKSIDGVYYHWRTDEFPDKEFPKSQQIGVIAQDIEKTLPEVVLTDANGYKSVDYSRITPVLVEAIKEQQLAPVIISGDAEEEVPIIKRRGFSRDVFSSFCAAFIRSGYP